jgi:hypothetical protein
MLPSLRSAFSKLRGTSLRAGPTCGPTCTSSISRCTTRGETFAEVTEGNPWPIGYVWERLRYDWSQPGSVKGVVTDSNIFKPGSTWEISATPAAGGSRVEVTAVRHLRGFKGRLLAPFFPLGLARRSVAAHLRHFLSEIERQERTSR